MSWRCSSLKMFCMILSKWEHQGSASNVAFKSGPVNDWLRGRENTASWIHFRWFHISFSPTYVLLSEGSKWAWHMFHVRIYFKICQQCHKTLEFPSLFIGTVLTPLTPFGQRNTSTVTKFVDSWCVWQGNLPKWYLQHIYDSVKIVNDKSLMH